jgi:hypothetical protein
VQRDSFDSRGVTFAERCERQLISVFCTSHKDWVRKPLVDERPVRAQVTDNSTGAADGRLHGRRTLEGWS